MLAKILEREPDWDTLPTDTPPIVRALIQRCLQKDRRDRLRDIGEAWVVLNGALTGELSGLALGSYESRTPVATWRRVLPWGLAASLAVALVGMWTTTKPVAGPTMRFTVSIPEEQALKGPRWPVMDLSPDGKRMVFVGNNEAQEQQLYLRHLHQLEATPLANTDGAYCPFFSPDGEWIAFGQRGKLRRISILGGPATTICEAANLRGGSWGPLGTIVFSPDIRSGV